MISIKQAKITREQAIEYAKERRGAGAEWGLIAKELFDLGYVSARTGLRLSGGGVHRLVNPPEKAQPKPRLSAPSVNNDVELARVILKMKIDDGQRVELLRRLLR